MLSILFKSLHVAARPQTRKHRIICHRVKPQAGDEEIPLLEMQPETR